jgi:hypothetical protein
LLPCCRERRIGERPSPRWVRYAPAASVFSGSACVWRIPA